MRAGVLAALPEAVGIWWPSDGCAGAMVCRDCATTQPVAAASERADSARALVLRGAGAAERVARRCVVHTGRFGDEGER